MPNSSYIKWQISLFSALILILVINPHTYMFTEKVFGSLLGKISHTNGCPTTLGLVVHTIVFILLIRGSMNLKMFTE